MPETLPPFGLRAVALTGDVQVLVVRYALQISEEGGDEADSCNTILL